MPPWPAIFTAILVQLLLVGFGMMLAGYSRAKNAANLLMMLLAAFSLSILLFWAIGHGIAFGRTFGGVFGRDGFFLVGESAGDALLRWWFHALLGAFSVSVVLGAIMGRVRFSGALIVVGVLAGFFFPIVFHWVWGAGWLSRLGVVDLGGATAIHLAAGSAGLVGAYILGPRFGRFTREGMPTALPAHNLPISAVGLGLVSIGWFGALFGRAIDATASPAWGAIAVNTLLAEAAASLTAMLFAWGRYGKPDVTLTLNGTVAGLVAISGVADGTGTVSALFIGAIGGALAVAGVAWLDRLRVDDPAGAVPVHGLVGLWGTLAVGLFHASRGVLFGGGASLLVVQAVSAFTVAVSVGAASWILFALLVRFGRLRAEPEDEQIGLDLVEHANDAYADFQRAEFK